jgi:hypothetical protein
MIQKPRFFEKPGLSPHENSPPGVLPFADMA